MTDLEQASKSEEAIEPNAADYQNGGELSMFRQIWIVVLILGMLTLIEFFVAINFGNSTVPLMLIALVKSGLVVNYFMHVYRLWREESH